jgi:hypothetical protein
MRSRNSPISLPITHFASVESIYKVDRRGIRCDLGHEQSQSGCPLQQVSELS